MKAKNSSTKNGRCSSRTMAAGRAEEVHSDSDSLTTTESPKASTTGICSEQEDIARGGVATPFPWKLHEMLEDATKEGNEHILSWQSHGRSFLVHKPKIFVEKIMPTYFNQSKFASFQRQLNLYGFSRLTAGKDKGAYYHPCFVRGEVSLCRGMVRQKIKGTKVRRTLTAGNEPDFYHMDTENAEAVDALVEEMRDDMPALNGMGLPELPATEEVLSVPHYSRKEVPCTKGLSDKLRRERRDALRDALAKTEVVCNEVERNLQESSVQDSRLWVPAVSPLVSEVSDSEDDSCFSNPLQSHIPLMPALPNAAGLPCEPRKLRFTTTTSQEKAQIKQGDVLFFEGKPFRYLEHLDALPPPPPSLQARKPKQLDSPALGGVPRDTLQSLMRVDPHALMATSVKFRQMS